MPKVTLQGVALASGRVSYRLYYTLNGRRHIKMLDIKVTPADKNSKDPLKKKEYQDNVKLAELKRLELQQQLTFGQHSVAVPTESHKPISFLDYFDSVAESPTWRSTTNHLKRYSNGKLMFSQVTDEWLTRFQKYLQARLNPSSVHTYMGIVTACLNKAVREKLIDSNPSKHVPKVHGNNDKPKHLTKDRLEELMAVSDELPNWFVDAFLFCCYTGLRISDLETLIWGEIDKHTTKHAETLWTLSKSQVKTQRSVTVPLMPMAVEILQRQLNPEKPLSKQDHVFKLKSRSTVKRHIKHWRDAAGMEFSFHSSRHTFGTTLLTAGVDITTISKLMGHKSIKMTMRYADVIDPVKEEAINKLHKYLG